MGLNPVNIKTEHVQNSQSFEANSVTARNRSNSNYIHKHSESLKKLMERK